jgi:hypothetical protein
LSLSAATRRQSQGSTTKAKKARRITCTAFNEGRIGHSTDKKKQPYNHCAMTADGEDLNQPTSGPPITNACGLLAALRGLCGVAALNSNPGFQNNTRRFDIGE